MINLELNDKYQETANNLNELLWRVAGLYDVDICVAETREVARSIRNVRSHDRVFRRYGAVSRHRGILEGL